MLRKKHILIFILIAVSVFALAACSKGTDTQVTTTATSTKSSNYKAPDMPDDMDHEPPSGMGFGAYMFPIRSSLKKRSKNCPKQNLWELTKALMQCRRASG